MARKRRRDVIDQTVVSINPNPIRARIAKGIEDAEYTSTHARLEDAKTRDKQRPRSGYV